LLMDSFERAKKGMGQAVSILAEAGVGKSRLLYEFRKLVANEDITFLEGKCLSYSRNVPYHPVIDVLKANFNIQDGDEDSIVRDKINRGLKTLKADETSILPYILEILSIKDTGLNTSMMSSEAKRERMAEAVKRITVLGATFRPLILAIEDLHWIDISSEEFLKTLLEGISGSRILLIFTYRPEFVHTWGGKSYHSQINLNRLSNKESLSMVYNILGTDQIDISLEETILNKTEGIPFFIEEYLKSLRDLNIIHKQKTRYSFVDNIQNISIPSTIQDVIMARVDSLSEGAKSVLQAGSAVEREFSYILIKHVVNIPEKQLFSHLSALKDAELVYERGIYPDTTYIFKHAFTRDVVYDSILDKQKRQLHDNIGNAIETLFGERVDDNFGILSEHFILSENFEKAAKYSRHAAKKADRATSFTDAITYAEKWVSSLEKLQSTEAMQKQLIDARTSLGFYYLQMQQFGEAKLAITPIVDLAEKHSYKKRLAQIFSLRGTYEYMLKEDYKKGIEYLKKSIQLAEETNNLISLIFSNHYLGHVYYQNCDFEKGYHFINKSLKIVEMGNVLWSIAMHKACIALNIFKNQGKIDLAYRSGKEAIQLAEESGDILPKAEAYTNYGVCCIAKGYLKEAKDNLIKGRKLCKRARIPAIEFSANYYLGEVYFSSDKYNRANECFIDAISIEDKKIAGQSSINIARLALAAVKIKNGEKDIDLDLLKSCVVNNKIKLYDGPLRRHLCTILLELDRRPSPDVQKWIEQAIAMDRQNGLTYELGMDHILYAEFFKLKGNTIKTKENLSAAINLFKECDADGWVEKYEKEFTTL
ncbi:MAG: AAA family ATPase, partial [Bacteroidota bacterium]